MPGNDNKNIKYWKSRYSGAMFLGIVGGLVGFHDLYLQKGSRFFARIALWVLAFVTGGIGWVFFLAQLFWWIFDLIKMGNLVNDHIKDITKYGVVFEEIPNEIKYKEVKEKYLKQEEVKQVDDKKIDKQKNGEKINETGELIFVNEKEANNKQEDQHPKVTVVETEVIIKETAVEEEQRKEKAKEETIKEPVICEPGVPVALSQRITLPLLADFPRAKLKGEHELFSLGEENHKWIDKDKPRFLFIDLETTGLDPTRDKIIEIALSLFALEDGQLHHIRSYVGWRESDRPIHWGAAKVNRLSDKILKNRNIDWSIVKTFFKASDFAIGHNALDFEVRFLKPFIYFKDWIDTMHFPWQETIGTKNKKQMEILSTLGISTEMSHTALYDTLSLAMALQKVSGGTNWLEDHFTMKKRGVSSKIIDDLREELLSQSKLTGKNEFAVRIGENTFTARTTSGGQVRWQNGKGVTLRRQDVENHVWRIYLESRNRNDRKPVEILNPQASFN